MPVFRLNDQIQFPPPFLAEPNGLLAIGGDLSPERLIAAYSLGIFPWYSPGDPLLWWFTSPRLVIFPGEFRVPKRLARYARNSDVDLTRDRAFSRVIEECAGIRTEVNEETWISPEFLHPCGYDKHPQAIQPFVGAAYLQILIPRMLDFPSYLTFS